MKKRRIQMISALSMLFMLFFACPNGVEQGGDSSNGGTGTFPGSFNYDITLEAVTIGETSISFKWSEVAGQNDYILLIKDSKTTSRFIRAFAGQSLTYTVEGLLPGKNYYLYVSDYDPNNTSNIHFIKHMSRTIEVSTSSPTLPQVQGFRGESTTEAILLTWNAIPGINNYVIEDLNSYEPVKMTYNIVGSTGSFTLVKAYSLPGHVYKFRIMALSGDGKQGGQFSEPITISLKPDSPR